MIWQGVKCFGILASLLGIAVEIVACSSGPAPIPSLATPVGAARGLNTFIYFYTDN